MKNRDNQKQKPTETQSKLDAYDAFVPRSRGRESVIGPLEQADRKGVSEVNVGGFRPNRTAEPLDGNRVLPEGQTPDKSGTSEGDGPQAEYDVNTNNIDNSSVPRNPKDSRPEQH
jgi:hypothetical protein